MRDRTENQIVLVMVRHGSVRSNREHRYLGKTDEPLSEEGIKELRQYKAREYYPDIDALFTSPMRRCVQTAGILFPSCTPCCIREWEEIDFGEFEGKTYMELQEDARYQEWIDSNGTLPFPKGESREAFIRRCEKGFEEMVKQVRKAKDSEKPKTAGMVVHGGTIMALLSRYCGGDYFDYQAANGRGYICICSWRNGRQQLTELRRL